MSAAGRGKRGREGKGSRDTICLAATRHLIYAKKAGGLNKLDYALDFLCPHTEKDRDDREMQSWYDKQADKYTGRLYTYTLCIYIYMFVYLL